MTNPFYDNITDKRSIPYNVAQSGSIVTFGTGVKGTGTLFLTQMKPGSYIVDLAAWELRRVIDVKSNVLAYLEEPFTVDIAPPAAQTSGVLVIGVTYTITTFVAGDDFVNVGGTNVSGNVFVATGTTPTTWTNLSSLDAAGIVPQIIDKLIANPAEISLFIKAAAADGSIFNKAFSGLKTFSKANRDTSSRPDRIEPIIVSGSGTSIAVTIIY